ncbi:MAG: hypothetical protein H6704_22670 [Myxococcales bacterium]|nr:hypothetical protein [Myxococcales bacterium]
MTRLLIGLSILAAAVAARAETVTVISPLGDGPATADAVAELGLALDRALDRAPRYARVNAQPLLPGEVRTAFGCLQFDADCARQAGEAAESALVLWPRLVQLRDVIEVRLALVDVGGGNHRELVRYLRLGGAEGPAQVRGMVAGLGALADALFDDRPAFEAGVVAVSDDDVALDGRAVPAGRFVPAEPGRHRLKFKGIPSTELLFELPPNEVLVLSAGGAPVGSAETSPRRIAAWMTTGVGGAALAGAIFTGARLAGTQNDYDREASQGQPNARRLRELAERGDNEALATNVLIVTGVVAAGVAIYLFASE